MPTTISNSSRVNPGARCRGCACNIIGRSASSVPPWHGDVVFGVELPVRAGRHQLERADAQIAAFVAVGRSEQDARVSLLGQKAGDVVELEIEGLGRQKQICVQA